MSIPENFKCNNAAIVACIATMANSGHLACARKHNFGPLKPSFCSTGGQSWGFAPVPLHLSEPCFSTLPPPFGTFVTTDYPSLQWRPTFSMTFPASSAASRLNLHIYGTLFGGFYTVHNLWVLLCSCLRDLFYSISCFFPIFHCCVQIDNLTYLL